MKALKLTNGLITYVDDEVYPEVSRYAWGMNGKGYVWRRVKKAERHLYPGTHLYLHRYLVPSATLVDHKDGNPLNNLSSNLRPATRLDNAINCKKQVNNTSGHKGLYWDKKTSKWDVRFTYNKVQYFVGRFADKVEALSAYRIRLIEVVGEFARVD